MSQNVLGRLNISIYEACLIVDVLNGHLITEDTAQLLWTEVEDACRLDHLDQKWGVDGEELVEKLKNMVENDRQTLIDTAKRFWEAAPHSGDIRETVEKYF